jgi:hypothetical protein
MNDNIFRVIFDGFLVNIGRPKDLTDWTIHALIPLVVASSTQFEILGPLLAWLTSFISSTVRALDTRHALKLLGAQIEFLLTAFCDCKKRFKASLIILR